MRAERVLEQTLGFLLVCGRHPGMALGPSAEVDKGWHTFVLDTAEYTRFCHRVSGRFIHHTPDEDGGVAAVGKARVAATVAAMRSAGLYVDEELWDGAADCSQCHAGCTDSPKRR